MAKIVASKVEVAKRQLSAAVRMLFAEEDPIAIHTVISAGSRIARDLVKHRKVQSNLLIENVILPNMQSDFWRLFNGPANFFKHANEDPDAVLDNVDEEVNDFTLFIGIWYFVALGEPQSEEMLGFQMWFVASHPQFFPSKLLELVNTARLGDFASLTREARVKQGSVVLDVVRNGIPGALDA